MTIAELLPGPFAWCPIRAGRVTLDHNLGVYDVPAFDMAQYPITNAQYQVFVDAPDGYADPRWWDFSPQARRWRAGYEPVAPEFSEADLPRTEVSWFEAVAFCGWLSAQTGESVSLPTEQEWQRAAQGDDERRFPWGDAFEVRRVNTSESGIKRPTPVTQFPDGASPYGVMDLSGNVAEWCLSSFNVMEDEDTGLTGSGSRVVRGGSWGLSHVSAFVTFRGYSHPGDRVTFQGFRIVRHR